MISDSIIIDAAQMESFDKPGAMLGTVSNVWEQLLVYVAQAVWTEALHACLRMFLNLSKRFQTFSNVRKQCSAGVNAPKEKHCK